MSEIKNYGKSIRARLLNVAKQEEVSYQTILTRYFHELTEQREEKPNLFGFSQVVTEEDEVNVCSTVFPGHVIVRTST